MAIGDVWGTVQVAGPFTPFYRTVAWEGAHRLRYSPHGSPSSFPPTEPYTGSILFSEVSNYYLYRREPVKGVGVRVQSGFSKFIKRIEDVNAYL
jgi:hypothetical protein